MVEQYFPLIYQVREAIASFGALNTLLQNAVMKLVAGSQLA
jgi:hypothetical protein